MNEMRKSTRQNLDAIRGVVQEEKQKMNGNYLTYFRYP